MEDQEGRTSLGMWSEAQDRVLLQWLRGLEAEQSGHSRLATLQRSAGTSIALVIIIVSAVVGSTFFRDINEAGEGSRLFFGLLSLAPGVLAAIQKLLQLSERGEKHALTAQRYRGLRREMEATLATPRAAREGPKETFQRLQREFEKIERDAPDLSYSERKRREMEFGVRSRTPVSS